MFEVDNVDNKNKVLCGVYRISNNDYNMIFKKFDNYIYTIYSNSNTNT